MRDVAKKWELIFHGLKKDDDSVTISGADVDELLEDLRSGTFPDVRYINPNQKSLNFDKDENNSK